MKNLRIVAVLLTIAPAAVGLVSCASAGTTGSAGGEVVPATDVGLEVRNQNFLDVNVYSVVDGMSMRLGTVTGNDSRHFLLDPTVGSKDFRLVAVPIGGFGTAQTGALAVSAGQTIVFTVGSVLQQSNAVVR